MMNALHLIWMIPLCAGIGYAIACLMWTAGK